MSAPDSTDYEKLLDKRLKWEAIEAKNIGDYITDVQNVSMEIDSYKTSQNFTAKSARQIGMKYLTNQRIVVIDKAYNGKFMFLDLRGRVIVFMKFAKPQKIKSTVNSITCNRKPGSLYCRIYR